MRNGDSALLGRLSQLADDRGGQRMPWVAIVDADPLLEAHDAGIPKKVPYLIQTPGMLVRFRGFCQIVPEPILWYNERSRKIN